MLKELSSDKKYFKKIILEEPHEGLREGFTVPAFGPMEPLPA
jgi:hypothetical protein